MVEIFLVMFFAWVIFGVIYFEKNYTTFWDTVWEIFKPILFFGAIIAFLVFYALMVEKSR